MGNTSRHHHYQQQFLASSVPSLLLLYSDLPVPGMIGLCRLLLSFEYNFKGCISIFFVRDTELLLFFKGNKTAKLKLSRQNSKLASKPKSEENRKGHVVVYASLTASAVKKVASVELFGH